jgi:hypothetical protein
MKSKKVVQIRKKKVMDSNILGSPSWFHSYVFWYALFVLIVLKRYIPLNRSEEVYTPYESKT